ncbi:hypothetical protein VNO77_42418 [Canavalia gladiata]|uniref:GTP cyclohydrolase 1 n=1 Tax=Canavalia gladiata TaxID=3824 RepID=A0AAN9JV70_CANGL
MGLLGESHLNCELEKGVGNGCDEEGFEQETNSASIEYAVKVLLLGLGEDINREGIRKTPLRVAKAICEGNKGYRENAKDIVEGALFPEAGVDNSKIGHAGGAGGLVIVRDLDLYSYCESCMLPFQVKCHVGYVPCGQRVLGLSKFYRVANVFAKRLQHPQRLANEVCSALHKGIEPAGVAIILQCTHLHFPDTETNHKGWVEILVSSGFGVFENKDADLWGDFLGLLKFRGIGKDKVHLNGSLDPCWCPSLSSKVNSSIDPIMVTAVSSILKSLGEDPTRKELVGTPSRFVKWLMKFEQSSIDVKLNGSIWGGVNDCFNTNGEVNFDDKEVYAELNLPFWSQCEHHLLPFYGVVHIGYFISKGVDPIGKSLLQSMIHFYGFKLQVQERLTRQIAETVSALVGGNVIVVVEASHTCMISRGIEKFGSNTATIAVLGHFSSDFASRAMFLESIPRVKSFDGY